MKTIKLITDKDVFFRPEFTKPKKFQKRVTVKAVVRNKDGAFGFVTNPIHGFVLLPGGGAENIDLEEEIKRECQEELFYSIKNIQEVERIKELRNRNCKEYETVCFKAEANARTFLDKRTPSEKQNQQVSVWLSRESALKKLKEQSEKLKKGEVKCYNTAFNVFRDYYFFTKYNN